MITAVRRGSDREGSSDWVTLSPRNHATLTHRKTQPHTPSDPGGGFVFHRDDGTPTTPGVRPQPLPPPGKTLRPDNDHQPTRPWPQFDAPTSRTRRPPPPKTFHPARTDQRSVEDIAKVHNDVRGRLPSPFTGMSAAILPAPRAGGPPPQCDPTLSPRRSLWIHGCSVTCTDEAFSKGTTALGRRFCWRNTALDRLVRSGDHAARRSGTRNSSPSDNEFVP